MARRAPPPDTSRMTSLKVDGIGSRCVVGDLEYLFERHGKIGDIYIPKDKYSGESRGFGFVRFETKADAEDAIDSLDGRSYEGRELRVQMAKYDRSEKRGDERRRSRSRGDERRRSRSRGSRRSRSRGRRSRSRSRDGGNGSRESGRRVSRSKSRGGSKSRSRSKSRS